MTLFNWHSLLLGYMTFYTNNNFPASAREIVFCMLLDVTYRIGAGFTMVTGDLSCACCLLFLLFIHLG
jgi:hypothetical protein